jgi:hypothetical protein
MAEELLVKETLTPEMIAAGRELIELIDQAGWRPTSAFWLFDSEQNRWNLVLSSPDVEKRGSRPAYEIVNRVLAAQKALGLSLSNISILPPRKEIVKLLTLALRVDGGSGVRFSRNAINGHYIEDAYVYRS